MSEQTPDDLRARKEAADQVPDAAPPDATEVIDGDEAFKRWKAEVDRNHAAENSAHIIALEADSGADIRALMETGQIRPKRLSRVELG